jgi:hypothetical protein
MRKFSFAAVLFALMLAVNTSAQTPFGSKDNRYDGYPKSLIDWPANEPTKEQLDRCASYKSYEPRDTHLSKYYDRLKVANTRTQETDECTYMRTDQGSAWVRRVKGTRVAVDELGRDLADLGSPTGLVCHNPRQFSYRVNVPATTTENIQTPTLVLPATPAPEPAPQTPAVTPLPSPAPTPVPPPPTPVRGPESFQSARPIITVGIGYVIGSNSSEYSGVPNPKTGDVTQKNNFRAAVPMLRIDQSNNRGVFGSVSANALGATSNMVFQDITGAWVTKKRDSDSTSDNLFEVVGGYKHSLGEYIVVGGFGGYSKLCLCENYVAQGATTVTERSYQGIILGGEASGTTLNNRLLVRVSGTFGPKMTRKSWTQQTYPGVNFPQVTNPDEDGKLFRFHAQGDIKIAWRVYGYIAYDHIGLSSIRPQTYTADESIGMNSVTPGVLIKF